MDDFRVIRNLKGGSFSATTVIELNSGEMRVRKSISRLESREYGLVRWQSQIRRMQYLHAILPVNTPPILEMGVSCDNFYYDIPFYGSSQNLYEYLSEQGKPEASSLFGKVLDLMGAYSQIEFGTVVGSFSVFFAEEVAARLSNAMFQIEEAHASGSISIEEVGVIKESVSDMLPVIDEIVAETAMTPMIESLTHGNFTLENALYVHGSDSVVLIDPYSETYSESILGDFSQLMQSSLSFYEGVVGGGEGSVKDLFNYSLDNQVTGVSHFGECLKRHIATFDASDRRLVAFFHGAQFVRMFPFKIEKTPRLAIYFLLHGLKIIKEGNYNA